MRILRLTEQTKGDLLKSLLKRSPEQYGEYEQTVKDILSEVREKGDTAVIEYTNRFDSDRINTSNIRVSEEEIEAAVQGFAWMIHTTCHWVNSYIIVKKKVPLNASNSR